MSEKPPIRVTKTASGFVPYDRFSEQEIAGLSRGTICKLAPFKGRSNPQLSWYWVVLAEAVEATGKWPTAKHLHDDLKLTLGYVRKAVNLNTGEIHLVPDSIAFDRMKADEFTAYLKQVDRLFSEKLGIDIKEMGRDK